MLKGVRSVNVKSKRILLRAGFNFPLTDEKIDEYEDMRIKKSLPTIEYLLEEKAKIIIISHLGKPQKKLESKIGNLKSYSLKPVAVYLEKLLNKQVHFIGDCVGEKVEKEIGKIRGGEIIMLENLRFYREEEANDEEFAGKLAELGDIFVNDAFSASHREHASIVGIPKFLPSAAGLLFEKEVKVLEDVLKNPKKPLVAIIGGAKISTKIKLVKKFLEIADHVILGGALVNTVLQAKGIAIGKSLTEEGMIKEVKELDLTDPKLHIPVDMMVSENAQGTGGFSLVSVGKIKEKEIILDTGSETNKLFASVIKTAKTVVWNGPMGLAEIETFSIGTKRMAEAIIESGAYSVVGGGDTISILRGMGLAGKMGYLSTGGGAMLEFLAEGTLPGIEALKEAAGNG